MIVGYMKNKAKIVAILCSFFWSSLGFAQDSSVDWKLYGGASSKQVGENQFCFYDAAGISQEAKGHIRVWTKCLLVKDMDQIDIKKDFGGQIVEGAAEKVHNHYVPPYAKIENSNFDQAIDIIRYEVTADVSDVEPSSRIFYELNCTDNMMRELDISVSENGKSGSIHKPREWQYIAPETNGSRLSKLLCPSQ